MNLVVRSKMLVNTCCVRGAHKKITFRLYSRTERICLQKRFTNIWFIHNIYSLHANKYILNIILSFIVGVYTITISINI